MAESTNGDHELLLNKGKGSRSVNIVDGDYNSEEKPSYGDEGKQSYPFSTGSTHVQAAASRARSSSVLDRQTEVHRPSTRSPTDDDEPHRGTSRKEPCSPSRNSRGSRSRSKDNLLAPAARSTKKEEVLKRRELSKLVIISRHIVENNVFIALTTALTMFALCGDDLRVAVTDRPADFYFNVATGFCLIVFTIEIFLSCIGKEGYFMGFFFKLDVVSTASLILDITTVTEAVSNMLVQGDEEDVENIHGVEAAQIAKAGRIVRVLRLVRILKLYKALLESNNTRKKGNEQVTPGSTQWEELLLNDHDEDGLLARESRVGKKLSDMTTRRVILLVLIMLLVLPFLTAEESIQLPAAPNYGADVVLRSFRRYLQQRTESERFQYELTMLNYIYYSNWFLGSTSDACPYGAALCSNIFLSHLFWIGIISKNSSTLAQITREATLRPSVLAAWEENISSSYDMAYTYGLMPKKVHTIITGRWDAACRVSDTVQRLGISLLAEKIAGHSDYAVRCPEDLRPTEHIKFMPRILTLEQATDWHFAFYYDLRWFTHIGALYSLGTTAFVCFVLTVASLSFANDANTLVLYPVEKMISKVEIIRDNPLMAMKMADEEFKVEEINKAKQKRMLENKWTRCKDRLTCQSKKAKRQEPMETVVLEKTIIKLGSLLALGFGEAGANIIETNMHGVDSACVDAMVEGTRVDCIIGCTRIRDFAFATEVLKQRVMTFVNQIAEIVHGVVDEFHGAANKNNGDMFLVIWSEKKEGDRGYTTKLVDMSMLAFARILGAVHRSSTLAEYRKHPGLKQRLGQKCRVNLSFGLHYGWAIEGAVGSEFKIDASYLSPNVSICGSVEKATATYGVPLLMAESMAKLCSREMAEQCRRIDRVIMTGSKEPMELFVMDLDVMSLNVDEMPRPWVWNSRQRFRVRQYLEQEKTQKLNDEYDVVTAFRENPDITAMRFRYTPEFVHVYAMGYENYSQGEWAVATRFLMRTKTMLGVEDGPSVALLKFMEDEYYVAPSAWNGTREL